MANEDQAQADLETTQTGEELETAATHDPIDGATNLAEYNALLEKELEPQADAVDDEPDAEVEEDDAGNGEETETTEETVEETETEEVEEETTEETEAPEEEGSKAQERFRIRAMDEVEATALALKKQNPKWSLSECLEKSKAVHGDTQTSAETQDDAGPKTVAEARSKIDELVEAQAEAMEGLEFKTAADIGKQIHKLRDTADILRDKESRESNLEQIAFNESVTNAKSKAVSIYPDVAKADSPLVKRMKEIDEQMQIDDNPLLFSPDKPFKLAQMAANDLGIAPRNPKAAPTTAKPAPVTRRPVQPASGSARTTAPTKPTDKLDQAVANAKDLASYEKLLAEATA